MTSESERGKQRSPTATATTDLNGDLVTVDYEQNTVSVSTGESLLRLR